MLTVIVRLSTALRADCEKFFSVRFEAVFNRDRADGLAGAADQQASAQATNLPWYAQWLAGQTCQRTCAIEARRSRGAKGRGATASRRRDIERGLG